MIKDWDYMKKKSSRKDKVILDLNKPIMDKTNMRKKKDKSKKCD
jgi:hypothetical protein